MEAVSLPTLLQRKFLKEGKRPLKVPASTPVRVLEQLGTLGERFRKLRSRIRGDRCRQG